MIEVCLKNDIIEICAKAISMGNGWSVTVTGGVPHLGAVALGIPRPSLRNDGKISSSVSILTITGHKEDVTVKKIAAELSAALNLPVVVSAGIHLDDITEEGIGRIGELVNEITDKLLAEMMSCV